MTNNDTSTLNGALQELGETMADNLTTMGVPSTYDEGLTTLAGKILDIRPTPPTPTPASLDLSLTAGKQILSYADRASGNEYATLSALVLDENDDPLPGVSVSIYKDNVLWYTAETGAGGTISKTYDSEGVGDVSFHAVCGSFVTETYDVLDTKAYYDNSKISSWSTSSGTGHVNYNSSYTMGNGETAYFKASSLPNEYVFGFVQGSSYCQLQKSGSNIRLYISGQSAPSVTGSLSVNDIIKFEKVSDTEQKIYINDNLVATASNHSMTSPNLMIRKYNNQPYTMDYIYVL